MNPHESIRAVYCYSLFTLTDFEVFSTNNNSLHFQKCILLTSHSGFTSFTTSTGSSLGNFFSSFGNFFSGLGGLSGIGSFSSGFLNLLGSFLGGIFDLLGGSIILSFLGLLLNRFNSGFDSFLNFFLVLFVLLLVFSFIEFLLDLRGG